MDLNKVVIPLIRKIVPNVIAQEIVGVQPMSANSGNIFSMSGQRRTPYAIVEPQYLNNVLVPEGHVVIDCSTNVAEWIKEQPIHTWKFEDPLPEYVQGPWLSERFMLSEHLYTLLVLKWG